MHGIDEDVCARSWEGPEIPLKRHFLINFQIVRSFQGFFLLLLREGNSVSIKLNVILGGGIGFHSKGETNGRGEALDLLAAAAAAAFA